MEQAITSTNKPNILRHPQTYRKGMAFSDMGLPLDARRQKVEILRYWTIGYTTLLITDSPRKYVTGHIAMIVLGVKMLVMF